MAIDVAALFLCECLNAERGISSFLERTWRHADDRFDLEQSDYKYKKGEAV